MEAPRRCLCRASFSLAILSLVFISLHSHAQVRDGGVDPRKLGQGDWIANMSDATNRLGGNVSAITNLPSLMISLKNQGMRFVIIKAGEGDTLFPSSGAPQFSRAVIEAAHDAGLWAFGYLRSFGLNVTGEIAVADYVLANGADGLVLDAEVEWERPNLPDNFLLATQLCGSIRSHWPNKFVACATSALISVHEEFPYREFGFYCDAMMPQLYWLELGIVPSNSVIRMSQEWSTWEAGLVGIWTNSAKPIIPIGQGWNGRGQVTPTQVAEFVQMLRTDPFPATAGGYAGVSYWRAELHPAPVWNAIRTNHWDLDSSESPILSNIAASSVTPNSATLIWTTDQDADSAVDFGLTAGHGTSVTNSTSQYYHNLTLTGLMPNTTYHYRARSSNASDREGVSADYVFTTASVTAPDIVVDDAAVVYTGAWTSSSTSTHWGSEYRFASTIAGGTATATFRPRILTPGSYNIYLFYNSGLNRATNAPCTVVSPEAAITLPLDQTRGGGAWFLLLSNTIFSAGTNGFVRLSNDTGLSGEVVVADAAKFVYQPSPAEPPEIAIQPQASSLVRGDNVTFRVVASGTPPLSYQWRFRGNEIPGATDARLTRPNVQSEDEGAYSPGFQSGWLRVERQRTAIGDRSAHHPDSTARV
jgi:hypothetical protein